MSQPLSRVTCAVLIIGDEILSGRTQDTNLNAIARYLAQRSAQGAPNVPAPRPAQGGGPARGFGRRVR